MWVLMNTVSACCSIYNSYQARAGDAAIQGESRAHDTGDVDSASISVSTNLEGSSSILRTSKNTSKNTLTIEERRIRGKCC